MLTPDAKSCRQQQQQLIVKLMRAHTAVAAGDRARLVTWFYNLNYNNGKNRSNPRTTLTTAITIM